MTRKITGITCMRGRLRDASREILARQTGQSGAPRVITTKARRAAPVRRLLARVRRGAHHRKRPGPARIARVLRTRSGQRCRGSRSPRNRRPGQVTGQAAGQTANTWPDIRACRPGSCYLSSMIFPDPGKSPAVPGSSPSDTLMRYSHFTRVHVHIWV